MKSPTVCISIIFNGVTDRVSNYRLFCCKIYEIEHIF